MHFAPTEDHELLRQTVREFAEKEARPTAAEREPHELVVPLDDLHPVGLLGRPGVGVERGDGGLGLVLAQAVTGEGCLEHLDALGDQPGVPEAAVQ